MCPDVNQIEPRGEDPKRFFMRHLPRKPVVTGEDPKAFLKRMSRQQQQQAAAAQQAPGGVPEH
jgi:hypothetical protein